jgi:DNA-binding transcriptional LysR family regulator
MNLAILKTFCDLVDTGSFSRAAESSKISQSAVSQQIAGLERDLGTCLLTRGGGFAAPTDTGKALYRGGRDIMLRYGQMLAEIDQSLDTVRQVLRVGTIYSIGFYLLDPYVRRFLQDHADVALDVQYGRWNQITAAVLNGEMDLGIVAFPEKQRSIEVIPFATEELVMVCSPSHPLARRKRVDPSALRGQRFVAFEANVPTRRYIDRVLNGYRVTVDIAMEFDNNETLKRAVEVGAGLTILPKHNAQREADSGHLVIVPFRDSARWVREIAIIRRRGKSHTDAEMMFLRILRSPT